MAVSTAIVSAAGRRWVYPGGRWVLSDEISGRWSGVGRETAKECRREKYLTDEGSVSRQRDAMRYGCNAMEQTCKRHVM
jgi:hypothetical protein